MELTQLQQSHLLKRLPDFELSYETISHNKVSNEYNLSLIHISEPTRPY